MKSGKVVWRFTPRNLPAFSLLRARTWEKMYMLHFVGLGPGSPDALPPRALSLLTGGLPVLVRTERHPVFKQGTPFAKALAALPPGTVTYLDDEYETGATFSDTYDAIVARVLRAYDAAQLSGKDGIVYAVPGHPLLGETTVARLLAHVKQESIPYRITGAPSFVDATLEAIGEAVTGDLSVIDALLLDPHAPAPPDALRTDGPILLYQVHGRAAASDAKLTLMRAGYPDDWTVTVVRAAGLAGEETVEHTPLYALDRTAAHDHLTSVWVPGLPHEERRPSFAALVRVMARLRDPQKGCPWDLKQSHESLRPYVLEEAYEVAEAIDSGDSEKLCDELGDLLLQTVFHAQIASEAGVFDSDDVCAAIVEKLIRRHPHIFGDVQAGTADAVLTNWNAIKKTEKSGSERSSILDGIPASYPALSQALETSKRVVRVGFEWPDMGGVLDKVEEEFGELRAEIEAGAPPEKVIGELGDLLFTLVNVARRLGADPEDALRKQLAKFHRRFKHIESGAKAQNKPLDALTLAEMEAFWQEAKDREKAGDGATTLSAEA